MKRLSLLCLVGAASLFGLWVSSPQAATARASSVVLSLSSSGAKSRVKSRDFSVTSGWQMQWSFSCLGVKTPDFHVAIFKPNGQRSSVHEVHLRSQSGYRTESYRQGGSFYLVIHSPCAWHIIVSGTAPAPTPTPTPVVPYTVQAQPRSCAPDPLKKGCADLGFSLASDGTSMTLTQKDLGYTIRTSKYGVAPATYRTGYMLFMYVKATKSTPTNGSLTPWSPDAQSFTLTAANGHPYSALSCGAPAFNEKDIYNGESNEGYVCSQNIDPSYLTTTFTWSFHGGAYIGPSSTYTGFDIPVVDVTLARRSP